MKPFLAPLALAAAPLALGACATTGSGSAPTEVSRYHLGQPVPPGTVSVEPQPGGATMGPELALYADAVSAELGRIGFSPVPTGTSSEYIAVVDFRRTSGGVVRTPPRFSIGVGGGSFGGGRGGGVGLGGGVSTGIGGRTRAILLSEISVALRRRADGTVVWEGKARRPDLSGRDDAQPAVTAGRLANALFRGFPGESGVTTTVR